MRYREYRYATDRQVRVAYDKSIERARLVNVSATGARLRDLPRLEPGRLVIICQLQLKLPAKVVWSNERQTGVTFLTPLGAAELQALANTVGQGVSTARGWRDHGFKELR